MDRSGDPKGILTVQFRYLAEPNLSDELHNEADILDDCPKAPHSRFGWVNLITARVRKVRRRRAARYSTAHAKRLLLRDLLRPACTHRVDAMLNLRPAPTASGEVRKAGIGAPNDASFTRRKIALIGLGYLLHVASENVDRFAADFAAFQLGARQGLNRVKPDLPVQSQTLRGRDQLPS